MGKNTPSEDITLKSPTEKDTIQKHGTIDSPRTKPGSSKFRLLS